VAATSLRTWRGKRDVALILLALLGPVVLVLVGRCVGPADGTASFPSAPAWGDGVVLAAVAGPAGDLRPGDRVVSVEGVPLRVWLSDPPAREFRIGDVLRYGVRRDGATQVQAVTVTLGRYPLRQIMVAHLGLQPFLAAMLAVAGYVVLRRPRDPVARALFRVAALLQFGPAAYPYSTQVIDVVTGRLWPLIVSDTASLLMWGALLHFTFVFPQPRGPAATHPRFTALAAYALPVALYGVHLASTLPTAADALTRTGAWVVISVPAANTIPLLAAAMMIINYWTIRDAATRQRMVWVFVAFGIGIAAYLGLGRLPEHLTGSALVPWDWLALAFLPVPLALAAAVLRYRLFDVDVIVRRSLVYGALAGALCLIYLGAAATFGALSGTPLSIGPLLAGALVVVLILLLRQRLHRIVMRLIFGDRDDPYEVLRRLGQRLEATASADSVLQRVVDTLAHTLRLPYVAVEVTGSQPYTASHGRPTGTPLTIPLIHGGEEVGRLVLDTGPVREPFGPDDRRLIEGLARQVAMTAHGVQLTARLQQSLERVVTAREEERRRLRRDIHDGLGPTLAAASLRVELARSMLPRDPGAAASILDSLSETQQQAIADIRRLVEGLRPPVLDQLGLVPALRERADRFAGQPEAPLSIQVAAPAELGVLPAAVEVAAYHIVSEALTNVVRHARAGTCTVRLWRDTALHVQVEDDGCGLPSAYRAGVGLNSIRERATELGGTASAGVAGGGGTVVLAHLPLPQSA
jgi:two-component system NarL family sensor kinase